MNCLYCDKEMECLVTYKNDSEHWSCQLCKSSLQIRTIDEQRELSISSIYTEVNNRKYVFHQDFLLNVCRIYKLPHNTDGIAAHVVTLNCLSPHINPSNIKDKLKTILLFL